jgi:hypothetical protein
MLLALAAVLVPSGAQGTICTIDDVPAATLLLPYFEVDLNNPNGINTLFSINNASASAVLAHVVLWSDLSVPTFDFNIYLTGYDVQTVSIRDIFNGTVPRTASAGQDPGDTISPKGTFSQDINFASCAGQLPPRGSGFVRDPPARVAHGSLLGHPERLRRSGLRRQHRPRLHHGR